MVLISRTIRILISINSRQASLLQTLKCWSGDVFRTFDKKQFDIIEYDVRIVLAFDVYLRGIFYGNSGNDQYNEKV